MRPPPAPDGEAYHEDAHHETIRSHDSTDTHVDAPLPEGWDAVKDPTTNQYFYVNHERKLKSKFNPNFDATGCERHVEASQAPGTDASGNSHSLTAGMEEMPHIVRELPCITLHAETVDQISSDDEAAIERLRGGRILPRMPGVVGTLWAWNLPRVKPGKNSAEDKAERMRLVMMRMLDRCAFLQNYLRVTLSFFVQLF